MSLRVLKQMNDQFQNLRQSSKFNPLFFLFLILGAAVVLPFVIISPAIATFRSGWSKQPRLAWRFFAMCTIALAILVTNPSSPWFWRLDLPIPPQNINSGWASWLLEMQRPYINAAIISLAIALPLSAASWDIKRMNGALKNALGFIIGSIVPQLRTYTDFLSA